MLIQDSKASTSTNLEEEENYTTYFDEANYEPPSNMKEMRNIYGEG
jgi:hypothetical protein